MQKSAIIVLYLKKNYTQLFFVLENFGAFKKNYIQQHSWIWDGMKRPPRSVPVRNERRKIE